MIGLLHSCVLDNSSEDLVDFKDSVGYFEFVNKVWMGESSSAVKGQAFGFAFVGLGALLAPVRVHAELLP